MGQPSTIPSSILSPTRQVAYAWFLCKMSFEDYFHWRGVLGEERRVIQDYSILGKDISGRDLPKSLTIYSIRGLHRISH